MIPHKIPLHQHIPWSIMALGIAQFVQGDLEFDAPAFVCLIAGHAIKKIRGKVGADRGLLVEAIAGRAIRIDLKDLTEDLKCGCRRSSEDLRAISASDVKIIGRK